MSDCRESRSSPFGDNAWDSEDGHQLFVDSHYSSPEADYAASLEDDYNTAAGYFDSEDGEGYEHSGPERSTALLNEALNSEDSSADSDYADPTSAHLQGREQSIEEDGDSSDRSEAAATPEYMYVDTQYTPPMAQGGENDPIVIDDTQHMPSGGHGSIVIGDTQMPDVSSVIDVATSPVRSILSFSPQNFPSSLPELGTSSQGGGGGGESPAHGRQRKHRASNADGLPESAAVSNKRRKGEEEHGDDIGKTSSPPPPPQPPMRARTQFKCAVCLDVPDPAVYVHPCGHVFCEGCAQGAAQTTGKCPVCRHAMRSRSIRVLQFRVAPIGRISK
ncbi:hypothetical protein GGI20_003407 [Coemansia sp. BCRC 34301]|nr:hypothetical protein GGI20_003407 [Coemansia sp. BCRC 34301]